MPVIDMTATGKNIKKMCIANGLSVKDIQNACGFTTGNAVYKWIVYLYNKLFGPRNENGSDKENDMILNMYENINKIKEMINDDEEINFKKINEIIDTMINDIKKVETREYKN